MWSSIVHEEGLIVCDAYMHGFCESLIQIACTEDVACVVAVLLLANLFLDDARVCALFTEQPRMLRLVAGAFDGLCLRRALPL